LGVGGGQAVEGAFADEVAFHFRGHAATMISVLSAMAAPTHTAIRALGLARRTWLRYGDQRSAR